MEPLSEERKQEVKVHVIKAHEQPIAKAVASTQLTKEEGENASEWIEPTYDMVGLENMVSHSPILPQCIRAYRNNIAGFGIGVRYKEDVKETGNMGDEFDRAKDILELLTMEMDTKELLENIIEARETFGISYGEVTRNLANDVDNMEFVKDTPSIRKTIPLEPPVEVTYMHNGKPITRKKKFMKYRQTIGTKTVYFKEFGDPRPMNKHTGEYAEGGVPLEDQASEILEFPIGTKPYGEVRWLGQVLGVEGSRQAEELNKNYFDNGRHTPLMIMVKNGTLTKDSFSKLQDYMNGIKGKSGQHAFLLLELEDADNTTAFTESKTPEVEVKDMASILQKDELFQDYLDNSRRKIQSSFLLPDLYVGYTTDFNRATAQAAMEVTEEQVFQPMRRNLAWIINNKLLNKYGFKHVEAYFLSPDITNPDDLAKILGITERAGGLTPNKAKEITFSILGGTSEPYEGEWGDTPLALIRNIPKASGDAGYMEELGKQLTQKITKAASAGEDEIVAVMKEVKSLLENMEATS